MATLPLSLKGKVKNTAGAGLGGITVTVYDSAAPYDNWAGQTETLKDGTYELHGLVAGHSYRIAYEDYNGTYASTFYNGKATLLLSNPVTASGQTLSDTVMVHTVNVERIAPTSGKFWTQSVNVARRQYVEDLTKPYNAVSNKDVWDDVTDIILTSGDVRAQSDPLSAAGLAWAYQVNNVASFNYAMNAPLLLVSATSATDASVLALIREIGEQNNLGSTPKRLTIHIVGGAVAVPEARFTEISKALTNAGLSAPGNDRVVKVGGRYDLAAGIARRMKQRAEASTTDELQLANFALVANGADSARFFDSLALSPVAASVGAPILLVSATSVPSATSNVITTLKTGTNPISTLYIGGGPVAVSDAVKSTLAKKLPTNRISGANRYATARAIADKGIAMKWLYEDLGVAVASTIADAQLGGAMAGNNGEPLLLTGSTSLESGDKSWLVGKKKTLSRVYLVGSTTSLNTTVFNAIKAAVAN